MPVGAGISAAGAIGSSLIGANASKNAANAQSQSAQNALAAQMAIYNKGLDIYNQAKGEVQPFIDTGTSASNSLAQLYGLSTPGNPGGAQGVNAGWNAFTNLPAYQFPLQQGMLALTRNLNAQGLNQSGAQTKEAQQFGQGLASQYMMGNYVTPLTSFMNTGQQAASGALNSATSVFTGGANYGSQIGASNLAIGQADASGILGAAKAYSGGLAGVTNSLGAYSFLSKQPGGNLGQFNPSSYNTTMQYNPNQQTAQSNFGFGAQVY